MKSIATSIAAAILLAAGASGQTRYRILDLENRGAVASWSTVLHSEHRVIAGAAPAGKDNLHAVLWYGGLEIDINANRLGGPNSQAFGVNERGQVVEKRRVPHPITRISAASTRSGFHSPAMHVDHLFGQTET